MLCNIYFTYLTGGIGPLNTKQLHTTSRGLQEPQAIQLPQRTFVNNNFCVGRDTVTY